MIRDIVVAGYITIVIAMVIVEIYGLRKPTKFAPMGGDARASDGLAHCAHRHHRCLVVVWLALPVCANRAGRALASATNQYPDGREAISRLLSFQEESVHQAFCLRSWL